MTQKQKLQELRKRGYSLLDIIDYAREHRLENVKTGYAGIGEAVNQLFDYESKFTAKQKTLELGELETNPFLNDNQGDLF